MIFVMDSSSLYIISASILSCDVIVLKYSGPATHSPVAYASALVADDAITVTESQFLAGCPVLGFMI